MPKRSMFDGVPSEVSDQDYGELSDGPGVQLRMNGEFLRCDCGCNVFTSFKEHPNVYQCNACEETFEVEKKGGGSSAD